MLMKYFLICRLFSVIRIDHPKVIPLFTEKLPGLPTAQCQFLSTFNYSYKKNILTEYEMVARDGIEPPTRGFSVHCSTD